MTAHPESVVGRLRAVIAELCEVAATKDDAAFHAARERCRNAKDEAFIPMLRTLERVWSDCHDVLATCTDELSDSDDGIRAMANGTIQTLAPLFTQPETPDAD